MFDDFVLFSSENPPDSSPAFPAEIIHKVTFATGAVWHYKIFTMPFAFACCTCFTVSYHLKFLSYKFERYLDSYPPFIMKIRSIYRMKERNRNKKTAGSYPSCFSTAFIRLAMLMTGQNDIRSSTDQ